MSENLEPTELVETSETSAPAPGSSADPSPASPPSFAESLTAHLDAAEAAGSEGGAVSTSAQPPSPSAPPPNTNALEGAAPTYADYAQALGFEGVESEADFQARLIEGYRLQQEREQQYVQAVRRREYEAQQYAQQLQQFQQSADFQAFQQWRQQQAAPQTQGQGQQSWWSPPTVDEDLARRYVQTDPETGKAGWAPDTPLEIRQAFEQREIYTNQWHKELLYDPPKAMQKAWEGEIRPRIEQMLAEREQQHLQRQQQLEHLHYAQQVQQQNLEWVYAKDPRTGQPLVDPLTQQLVPTPQGALVMQNLALIDQATRDPRAKWDMAVRATLGALAMQPPQQVAQPAAAGAPPVTPASLPQTPAPGTAQSVAQQRRQELLNRNRTQPGAGHIAPRGGTFQGAGSQNPNLSFSEKLEQQLIEDGVSF